MRRSVHVEEMAKRVEAGERSWSTSRDVCVCVCVGCGMSDVAEKMRAFVGWGGWSGLLKFRYSSSVSEGLGVNFAFGVFVLEALVRRWKIRWLFACSFRVPSCCSVWGVGEFSLGRVEVNREF